MNEKNTFLEFIEISIKELNLSKQKAVQLEVEQQFLDMFDKFISHCLVLKNLVNSSELSVNYLNQFKNDIESAFYFFSFRQDLDLSTINNFHRQRAKKEIENNINNIGDSFDLLQFNFDFFKKLGFFNNNIVAIGANGSGKTSLSNKLKVYLKNNGVVISAQRILLVPAFDSLHNPLKTAQELRNNQMIDKSNKNQSNFNHLQQEFSIVLKNLLADNIKASNVYRLSAFQQSEKRELISNPTKTNLDRTLEIWNSLIEHRLINCTDGMNINAESENKSQYPLVQMSDGEKVMLFLIAQVLQAPSSGFIIIDEPEMYLHKTILKKLWNILEKERQDCIFIYLTHDLDFATSRTTAKKIWIRSYTFPETWEIESIPENDLPESLLLELLGSRKNILFCEGKKGSLDEKIYNILFQNFTITPVENCFSVINYTKAYNKLNNTTKAYGIIDSDHHELSRLKKLESENIFSFSMAESENLFLDEEFLKILAKQLLLEESIVEKIKADIINELQKTIELQLSNYVSAKINYYFKDSHVSKGNTLKILNENYSKFTAEVKIQDWYSQRESELKKIIENRDFSKILSVFNHKGLQDIANKRLKISDFSERSIKLLQYNNDTHDILRKHFPTQLL